MTEQVAGTRATCKYPGCENPPAPATKPGRPPGFCELEEHNKLSAWRERQRLDAEARGDVVNEAQQAEPVTYSLTAGAELLRQVRAAGERQRTDIDRLIAHLDRLEQTRPPAKSRSRRRAPSSRRTSQRPSAAQPQPTAAPSPPKTPVTWPTAQPRKWPGTPRTPSTEPARPLISSPLRPPSTRSSLRLPALTPSAASRPPRKPPLQRSPKPMPRRPRQSRRAEADADATVRAAETRIAETERQAEELISQVRADAEAIVRAAEADRDQAREQTEQYRQAAQGARPARRRG